MYLEPKQFEKNNYLKKEKIMKNLLLVATLSFSILIGGAVVSHAQVLKEENNSFNMEHRLVDITEEQVREVVKIIDENTEDDSILGVFAEMTQDVISDYDETGVEKSDEDLEAYLDAKYGDKIENILEEKLADITEEDIDNFLEEVFGDISEEDVDNFFEKHFGGTSEEEIDKFIGEELAGRSEEEISNYFDNMILDLAMKGFNNYFNVEVFNVK